MRIRPQRAIHVRADLSAAEFALTVMEQTNNGELFYLRLDSDAIVRVFSRIRRTENDCWEWHGQITKKGYGFYRLRRMNLFMHRLMYAWAVGPIPRGYKITIDHLCRNRRCCNPVHLELVPCRENHLRGLQSGKTMNPNSLANLTSTRNKQKTLCKRGHLLSGDNLSITSGGARQCIACRKVRKEKLAPPLMLA